MKRLAPIVILLACGDGGGPLGPEDLPTVTASLEVVGGDSQADTIEAMLAEPITVRLQTLDTQEPLVGVIVNFVVVEPECGRPFAGSALTDVTGQAAERWELGTRAGPCTMEARAVDADGTPRVLATASATVQPGAAHSMAVRTSLTSAWVGDTLNLADVAELHDRAGNVLPPPVPLEAPADLSTDGAGRYWSEIERAAEFRVSLGGVPGGERITAAWLADLRRLTWSTSFSCQGRAFADSVSVEATSDSVTFSADIGHSANTAGFIWFSGERTEYRSGASTVVSFTEGGAFFIQTVGRLDWGGGGADNVSVSDAPVPEQYIGGNLCRFGGLSGSPHWDGGSSMVLAGG